MDQEQRFGFDYKDRYIPISDVGKAGDEITNEFNSLIDHLKLKYSFATISKLTDSEWEKYPINLCYDGTTIALSQFVEENQQLHKELTLLDSINGMEARHNIKCLMMSQSEVAICIEVFRLFQDVYNTFSLARFSLLEGYRKLHLCSTVEWKSGAFGQYWIRTAYLNNAIIWYNSCFDILSQTLWIAKQYYVGQKIKFGKGKVFVKEDIIYKYDDILKNCSINEDCFSKFIHQPCRQFIHEKANSLKHRNSLRYKELVDPRKIAFFFNDYCSTSTESNIDIDSVIKNLISYHKDFVSLVNEVKAIVSAEFKSRYNIEL